MNRILKSGFVVILIASLLPLAGCFGLGETPDLARSFFQMIADGDMEGAYDSTGDMFKEYTSYDDFVVLSEPAELASYLDFQSSGFEYSTEDGYTIQTLTGDWYDTDGYYYPLEVYFVEVDDEWTLVGFYFTE